MNMSMNDVLTLTKNLSIARALPDGHPCKDGQMTTLELRVQQAIDELDANDTPPDDQRLLKLHEM